MIDDEFRRYLRELYRADDKFAAEHREYMAQRRALASPPVSETEDVALYAVPDQQQALCYDEDGQPFLLPFSDAQADAIAEVTAFSVSTRPCVRRSKPCAPRSLSCVSSLACAIPQHG